MGGETSKKNREEDNQSSETQVTEGSKGQTGQDIGLIEKMQPNVQLPEEKAISGIESTGLEPMEELDSGRESYHLQELVSKYVQMNQNVSMLEESYNQMLSTLDKLEDKYHQNLRETVAAAKELQGTNTEVGTAETNMAMDIVETSMERCMAESNTKMDIAETDIQELATSVETLNMKLKELLQDNSDGHNELILSAFCEELSPEQIKATRKDVSQMYGHVSEYLVSRSGQVAMVTDETRMDETVTVYNLPGYVPRYHLTKSHKKFSRTLKRRKTLRSHDNRIGLHYDMESVEGCITQSEDKEEKEEDLGVVKGCDMGARDSRAGRKSVDKKEKETRKTASKGLAKKSSIWKEGKVVDSDLHCDSKSSTTTETNDTNGSQANKEHEKSYKNCYFESIPLALIDVNKVRAQGYQIEEENQKVKLVDEAYWTKHLEEAVSNGSALKSSRGTGFDTILLVDISASMRKEKWIQTITFLHNFLDGIESSQNYLSGAFEYLSLVVFGHETRVVQHLTCDYVSLRKHLDCLYPDGPSPLTAGVAMCNAALEAAGHVYSCQKVTVYPRILLITDGHPTDTFRIAGPDTASNDETEQEQKRVLNMFKKLRVVQNIRVFPVPIGDFDKDFLEKIASATNGKVVSAVNWRKLSNYQKQVDICCKLAVKNMNMLLFALYRAHVEDTEDASFADMEEADELLQEHKERARESKEYEEQENEFKECDPNMPPLGTRVVRGPNWRWDIQDSNGHGTVIGHEPRGLKGWISVKWDQKNPSGCDEYNYRYGADGAYDILTASEPRLLQLEEDIAVGCIVKRGKDWEGQNQDGGPGNTGVVLKVYKKGLVKVRWQNGMTENYRFGCDQKYDVELCNPFEVSRYFEGGGRESSLTDAKWARSTESIAKERTQNFSVANRSSTSSLNSPPSSRIKNVSSTPIKEESSVSTLENLPSAPAGAQLGKRAHSMGKNLVTRKKIVPQVSMGNNATGQLSNKVMEASSLQENEETRSVQQNRQDLEVFKETGSKRRNGDTKTSGAIPKSNGQNQFVQMREEVTDHSVVWQWRNPSGDWISFDQEICQQLENRFQKNPGSSITINHQNQMYRVVFSRMQRLNTTTREWTDVQRLS
ncbi:hypothetical protein ACJMK2_044309 [Sinanodonta woodiana]|uniref:E3 ubiquitin-protein ligase HERC2 n=1 Tax=Sinanodonta woodiana TaxID=1069815 RepID=A0ABD3W096_SINWO